MRTRAIIHVAGPPQPGKTSFVEAVLSSLDAWILAARRVRDHHGLAHTAGTSARLICPNPPGTVEVGAEGPLLGRQRGLEVSEYEVCCAA
jgi:hypothetical protein